MRLSDPVWIKKIKRTIDKTTIECPFLNSKADEILLCFGKGLIFFSFNIIFIKYTYRRTVNFQHGLLFSSSTLVQSQLGYFSHTVTEMQSYPLFSFIFFQNKFKERQTGSYSLN